MFHSATELLIDYWRSLRGEAAVPSRASVDPAGFVAVAPRTFIAARDMRETFAFRLAGESLIDLHGRPLHGQELSQLWRPLHRRRLEGLLDSALAAGEPLVISAEAWTAEGSHLRLEVLFLPLAGPSGLADRFLGLYQPQAGVWRGPIGELALLAAFGVADEAEQLHLRLATVDGRQIA
ncbi:MAG TPA: PAS domain-containing protein [Caulobacteraceae bacterium]|nr:PAS domain-containing protein [Caulobacteraceae bacterium]